MVWWALQVALLATWVPECLPVTKSFCRPFLSSKLLLPALVAVVAVAVVVAVEAVVVRVVQGMEEVAVRASTLTWCWNFLPRL